LHFADCWFLIADCWIADCCLLIGDCWLLIAELLVADCWLLIADCWMLNIDSFQCCWWLIAVCWVLFNNSDCWLLIVGRLLLNADCWLLVACCWISDCRLLIVVDCWLLSAEYWFAWVLIADCWLLFAECWSLLIADCSFLISDCWLLADRCLMAHVMFRGTSNFSKASIVLMCWLPLTSSTRSSILPSPRIFVTSLCRKVSMTGLLFYSFMLLISWHLSFTLSCLILWLLDFLIMWLCFLRCCVLVVGISKLCDCWFYLLCDCLIHLILLLSHPVMRFESCW